ncbi:MAG: cupin domain-containing protein [Steroidobacteraceae bacterium]
MRRPVITLFIALAALLVAYTPASNGTPETAAAAPVMVVPDSINWKDQAPGLPPGVKRVLLVGDPAKAGPYVERIQFPAAGIRIAPHWHTSSENVTVLSGTMAVGVGDTFDQAAMRDVPAGSYYLVPPRVRHYLMSKSAAIIQVHGIGPMSRVFVNPAADLHDQAK